MVLSYSVDILAFSLKEKATRDIVGQVFGRLTAIRPSEKAYWLCKCECGGEKTALIYNLLNGRTQSCGCLQKQRASAARLKHGMSGHPAYHSWASMSNRCNNPNASDWDYYGARGIKVCPQWRTFDGFWADMGPLWQAGLTIDRIDNDGDYTPANCRWVTQQHQIRNRRNNRMIDTPWGRMCAAEAAERAGLRYGLFIQRVRAGWSMDDLFRPNMRRTPS